MVTGYSSRWRQNEGDEASEGMPLLSSGENFVCKIC